MCARTVLFYGQSLLLSLLAADLARSPELRVKRAATWAEVEALTAQGIPDVLLYDPAGVPDSRLLALLFQDPGLLLIGLDPETNRAVMLTGREEQTLTLERMREILEQSQGRARQAPQSTTGGEV